MKLYLNLNKRKKLILIPKSPYNADANFHKPSHFPSSDNFWEKGKYWISMAWKGKKLGLKLEDIRTINKPKIRINIYSQESLSDEFIKEITSEIEYRFNFNQDISKFCKKYKKDKILRKVIKKWGGMKPIAANSLYETLIIYFVLQNASVKRSMQMLENLFNKYGTKIKFDNKILFCFWEPGEIKNITEEELRNLKLGYRAKFILKLTQQFINKEITEFELRKISKEKVREKALSLYGIGPASIEYLLFEDFYFLDNLKTIPPWEQKILSKLLFNQKLVNIKKILKFFKKYKGYEKLASHYLWEDLFWKRKNKHIGWLEKEIRS